MRELNLEATNLPQNITLSNAGDKKVLNNDDSSDGKIETLPHLP